jgi:hypothetical protein
MNVFQTNTPVMITCIKPDGHKDLSAADVHIQRTGRVPGISISVNDANISIRSPLAQCFTASRLFMVVVIGNIYNTI